MNTLKSKSIFISTLISLGFFLTPLTSGQSEKWIVKPSSNTERNTELYTETIYYNTETISSGSTGKVTHFSVREDTREPQGICCPEKHNRDEDYNSLNENSYRTIYRNAQGEKVYESGMLEFTTGVIAEPIDDLEFWDQPFRTALTLPDDAYVTNVEYKTRVSYVSEPTTFACEDYEIYLYSERLIPIGIYYNVYDNLGSLTDGGYDDDEEDDRDIYLNWRSTDYFNGDDPSGWWGARVEDNMILYSGKIDYFNYRIYWETPKPNLTFTNPPGWEHPIIASSVAETNTDGPDLIADETTYVDMTYTLEDQATASNFTIALFIDGSLFDTWNISNHSTGTFPNEDYEVIFGHGDHDICVSLDDDEDIDESDEYDNLYCRTFYFSYPTPSIPMLTFPADGSDGESLPVALDWSDADYTNHYKLQVDDNEDFSSPVIDDETLEVSFASITGLNENTDYYWRVQAINVDGSSAWSEVWNFKTEGVTGPSTLTDATNSSYILKQNYPNPFMKTTTIDFALPVEGEVIIELMDMQGKVIESISGYYPSGSHSVTVNGKFQPGVYIYRMKANEFIDSKLCIVQ